MAQCFAVAPQGGLVRLGTNGRVWVDQKIDRALSEYLSRPIRQPPSEGVRRDKDGQILALGTFAPPPPRKIRTVEELYQALIQYRGITDVQQINLPPFVRKWRLAGT